MSTPNRVLAILQLFEERQPIWTVEEIARALNASTSTTYRHVRALVQQGFLDPVTGAGYALGPAFIRYDRILRQNDELIGIATPVMKSVLADTSQSATVILCRRFKDCVMCVHDEHGAMPHDSSTYERGVAMPLFLGATSKVILANLPERTLRSVYLRNEKTIRETLSLGGWDEFKNQIRAIKRAGFAVTDSEVSPGRVGLAAPIFRGNVVIAGLSLVIVPTADERNQLNEYAACIRAAAESISYELRRRGGHSSR